MALNHPKILPLDRLLAALAPARASGKTVVFTNGCFDIMHPGHVDLLARCRAMGDILALGLNSDDSVRRQGKTPPRPINAFESRAYVLAHLESISYVVGFEEDTPLRLIEAIRPDVLVKGGDWSVDKIVGRDVVEAYGGKVASIPLIPGYSTTALIEKIKGL